jgi:hypothetical protein
MVGPPKSLFDLHRIEAQVEVTCRSCRAMEVWELKALIAEAQNNGGNTNWNAARWSIKCPRRCPSPILSEASVQKLSYIAQTCHVAPMRRTTNVDVEFTIVTILIIVAFANGIMSGLMAL